MLNVLPPRLRALRRRAGGANHSRGQSLVEFAMALPVILLLTLIALDFGRVYLGYINLQNMARIAANFAANHPEAWDTSSPDTDLQARYRNQILADASATNCELPTSGGSPVVPDPSFTDTTADGIPNGLGDTGTVQLTCRFGVITPFIANIVGGSVRVSAESNFLVKTGMSAVAGGTGEIGMGTPPNAAFSANSAVITPDNITVIGPTVDVEFRDTSGGVPTAWAWDFADGTTSPLQDPLGHTFTCAFATCSFLVTMTASNNLGSAQAQMTVTVIGNSDVNFTADHQSGVTPFVVNFTDASTSGGTAYEWDFGDGSSREAGPTLTSVSHTYTAAGTYDVSLTVTYPDPTGAVTTVKQAFISVGVGLCTVPTLTGVHFNDAQAIWQRSPYNFTGIVVRDTGAPSGNFVITAQSLAGTSLAPCNSNVTVSRP